MDPPFQQQMAPADFRRYGHQNHGKAKIGKLSEANLWAHDNPETYTCCIRFAVALIICGVVFVLTGIGGIVGYFLIDQMHYVSIIALGTGVIVVGFGIVMTGVYLMRKHKFKKRREEDQRSRLYTAPVTDEPITASELGIQYLYPPTPPAVPARFSAPVPHVPHGYASSGRSRYMSSNTGPYRNYLPQMRAGGKPSMMQMYRPSSYPEPPPSYHDTGMMISPY